MANNQILKTFINKLKTSEQFAARTTVVFLKNNSNANIIEDFNRKQMSEGKDANDQELGNYGEMRTMQRMLAGKQVGFIDLDFTNTFHKSVFVNSGLITNAKPAILIGSSDPKYSDIVDDERFKDALGLKGENRDKVGMMIALEIQKELLRYYKP